jgi:hypothetical protein
MLNDLVTAVLVAVAAVIVSGLCEHIAPSMPTVPKYRA